MFNNGVNTVHGLEWRKRKKVFESRNNVFNPENMTAWSYSWMYFKKIGKLNVFNEYRYSNATACHQDELRYVLKAERIKIDLRVNTQESLSGFDDLVDLARDAIEHIGTLSMEYFKLSLTKRKYKKCELDRAAYEIQTSYKLISLAKKHSGNKSRKLIKKLEVLTEKKIDSEKKEYLKQIETAKTQRLTRLRAAARQRAIDRRNGVAPKISSKNELLNASYVNV